MFDITYYCDPSPYDGLRQRMVIECDQGALKSIIIHWKAFDDPEGEHPFTDFIFRFGHDVSFAGSKDAVEESLMPPVPGSIQVGTSRRSLKTQFMFSKAIAGFDYISRAFVKIYSTEPQILRSCLNAWQALKGEYEIVSPQLAGIIIPDEPIIGEEVVLYAKEITGFAGPENIIRCPMTPEPRRATKEQLGTICAKMGW